MKLDFQTLVPRIDSILSRGLSAGVGQAGKQVCIEAAICEALDLPHGDDPLCVAASVRSYKIRLNDSNWSSAAARAAGLRDLGIAQLGSLGVVDDIQFSRRMAIETIRVLIPDLFRSIFTLETPEHEKCRAAADRCAAADGDAARWAADAAAAAAAAEIGSDHYLKISAGIALRILREMKSPGCEWI